MKFDLRSINKQDIEPIYELMEQWGHTFGEGGTVISWKCGNTDKLEVDYHDGLLTISGSQKVHFYRGLLLFLAEQMNSGEKCERFNREEKICFSETGILLDCSRNSVPSISFLKELIRFCACCGLNQFYLYMEDVYEIPGNKYFGAYRGRYSRSELEEVDRYAGEMGVEVMPAIQTLAHMHTYLRWTAARKLRDTEDILLAGSEETEEFIKSMIRNASLPFRTDKIHIGMDEADLLGLGKYLRLNGYRPRYEIMTEHLKMVCGICRDMGLKPMIWSDMFFRLKSPCGDYYDLPEETEFGELLPLPEDLTLVYWDYYHHDSAEYEKNIRLHHKLTEHVRFAGGGWTWNGIAPNYSKAEKTMEEGLKACRRQEIDKVICTFWFDNGSETPVKTAFYPAALFAQYCFESSAEDTDRILSLLTGVSTAGYRLLDRFDAVPGTLPFNENADNPSKYLLYQDVLVGLFDEQIRDLGMDAYYSDLAGILKKQEDEIRDKDMKKVFSFYQTLAGLLAGKSELGLKICRTYADGDKETMGVLCEKLETCEKKAYELKELRKQIWFGECRPFGFEVLDIRLGAAAIRMESARKRLESWISGEAESLEELEVPRILYTEDRENPEHRQCAAVLWQNIVSAGNIAGV